MPDEPNESKSNESNKLTPSLQPSLPRPPRKRFDHAIRSLPTHTRVALERAILAHQLSDQRIADKFTTPEIPISRLQVMRYRLELKDLVALANNAQAGERAGEARTRLEEVYKHIEEGIVMAKEAKSPQGLAAMINQAHKNIELTGQLTGEFAAAAASPHTAHPIEILIGFPKHAGVQGNYASAIGVRIGGEQHALSGASPGASPRESFLDSLEEVDLAVDNDEGQRFEDDRDDEGESDDEER